MFRSCLMLTVLCTTVFGFSLQAQETPGFDVQVYQTLEAEMQSADEARSRTEVGTEEWVEATWNAIDVRQMLITFLGQALDAGEMNESTASYADDARLILMENVVSLLVDLGECEQAQRAADLISGLGEHPEQAYRRAYENTQIEVATCRHREIADITVDEADTEEEVPEETGPRIAGPVLIGTGGAVLVVGVVLDVVTVGLHGDFETATEQYEQTGQQADYDDAQEIQGTIDGRVPWLGVLYGVGAGLAVTGIILMIVDSDDSDDAEDTNVTWTPMVGPTSFGVHLRF